MKSVILVVFTILIVFTINKLYNKRKEKQDMAVIYATLIIKGKRTIGSVPAVIKEQVKQVLIDLECPELAEEGNV